MIVWVNGVYAVGKSTVASELARHLPEAILYDPEPIGYYVRDMVKRVEKTQDYQELAIFRSIVLGIAQQLTQQYPQRAIIMPLGVWQPGKFAEIRDGLEQCTQLKHFCLTASRSTINQRLLYRGDGPQASRWIRDRLDDAIDAMHAPQFETCISTNGRTPGEVVQLIMEGLQ